MQAIFQFIILSDCSPFQFRIDGQIVAVFRLHGGGIDTVQRNMCLRQTDHPDITVDSGTAVPSAVG